MKIHFDIDATPQELRSFFGLPNLEPLQNEILEIIRQNMSAGIEGFDPATVMKPFLPEHLHSLTALQKSLWEAMLGQSQSHTDSEKEKKSGP
ncbi:MAG TPA: hypothetical protein EYP59_06675 [Thiotrichaceae bacterium]|nr:hypothetical protein [Thiotrichaceae bacterium]